MGRVDNRHLLGRLLRSLLNTGRMLTRKTSFAAYSTHSTSPPKNTILPAVGPGEAMLSYHLFSAGAFQFSDLGDVVQCLRTKISRWRGAAGIISNNACPETLSKYSRFQTPKKCKRPVLKFQTFTQNGFCIFHCCCRDICQLPHKSTNFL